MTSLHTSTRLRDCTLAKLKTLPRTEKMYTAIAKETGLEVKWMLAFSHGRINNPSVNRIECLWEYLNGRQLPVE